MADKEVKEPKKKQRISGTDYWRMRDTAKKVDKARERYQKWLRQRCKVEKCYVDQIENVLSGRIVEDPTKEQPQGAVRRASNKFVKDAEIEFEKLQAIVEKYNDLHDDLAKEYGVLPEMLDPKTGIISEDTCETAVKKSEQKKKKK